MPNYIAPVNAPAPAARPVIDVGDIINSVSNAFQANKQGVLTRAVLQHRVALQDQENNRANDALDLQKEQHQIALRQSGALPPEEVLGQYGAQPAPPTAAPPAAPGPVSAALPPSSPVVPGVAGMPSPGRIAAIARPDPAATLGPAGPGMLSPTTTTPTSQPGSTAVAPAPVVSPLSPAEQATRDGWMPVGGTGPNAHWLINPHKGTYQEQRETSLNQQSLSAANESYARDHPGAPPLYTDAEIATGSRNPKAYAQLVGRAENVRQASLDRQQRFVDLQGVTDATGQPLTDVQRTAIANDPVAYRNFIQNQVNPKENPLTLHQQERQFDQDHPLREAPTPEDKEAAQQPKYVLTRIRVLTKPHTDPLTKIESPGLSLDAATQQAEHEWDVAHGKQPAAPENPTPVQAPVANSQPEYDRAAALYKQAIAIPGLTPEQQQQARDAYSQDLVSIGRKYGQVK